MSNPEQFRAETAIGLVKPFHRVECRCKACIAWLQIELCKQWAEVWRLKADYDAKCEAYHEVVTNYGPAIDEAKRLRAKTAGLETENQTLLVKVDNRDTEMKRQREVLRECRRFIDTTPVASDLWASGLCLELDEVLKRPPRQKVR